MRAISALLLTMASCAWTGFWMENIRHQGLAPFNPDKSYVVFRNVKDFGAKGDGVTDDAPAINAAISSGNRCGGPSCVGSTTTPAVVYFPPGTYLINSPIVDFYYTQIVGDPNDMPIIKGAATFPTEAIAMFDGDPYLRNGYLNFQSTNVFFRQLRNIIFDTTDIRGNATALHWPSSQATSIQNCVFRLSSREGDIHTGIFMEEGSGGLVTDLVFIGGKYGARFGNQQYTMRNLSFYGCGTAIQQIWNWGWTYKSLKIVDCDVGIDMSSWDVGSVILLDSKFVNVKTAMITSRNPGNATGLGSLVIQNVVYQNVPVVLANPQGQPYLLGEANGAVADNGYARGNVYAPRGPRLMEGRDFAFSQPPTLKTGDLYYERSKPQYGNLPASSFLSARDLGARGDGVSDDTAALNVLFQQVANTPYVAFLDSGVYKVTDTIYVPPNTRIVGEPLSAIIMGAGKKFADANRPRPVVQVAHPGEIGYVEMSDIIVSTQGATAGAIGIEYNLNTPAAESICSPGAPPSGLWDVHVRIGGFTGSQLQVADCAITPDQPNLVKANCIAGFMSMHVTPSARNLYMENNWIWVADHDIDDPRNTRVSIFVARGLLIEGTRIWLVGSSVEHHTLYQYQLVNATDVWMGQIQTETPYYQPNPPAPFPFTRLSHRLHDPDFAVDCSRPANPSAMTLSGNAPCSMAWGLRVLDSKNVVVFGAGLYSFFNNYSTNCSTVFSGENCQARIFWVGTTNPSIAHSLLAKEGEKGKLGHGPFTGGPGGFSVEVYNLDTIGSVSMATLQGYDMAMWDQNVATFASTLAVFKA